LRSRAAALLSCAADAAPTRNSVVPTRSSVAMERSSVAMTRSSVAMTRNSVAMERSSVALSRSRRCALAQQRCVDAQQCRDGAQQRCAGAQQCRAASLRVCADVAAALQMRGSARRHLTRPHTGAYRACYNVEDRKIPGVGGRRRYGRAGKHIVLYRRGSRVISSCRGHSRCVHTSAHINRKNRRVAEPSSRWPLALVDES